MISFGSNSAPLASPGSTPRVVVEALMHRGELASVELKEARQHGSRTAILAGVSGVLLLLGGFSATFAVAAAVWDSSHRGLILGLLTLGYLVGAGVLALVAARRMRDWKPFTESARQFRDDCACIHEIINSYER
ncbi:MAG TPA: phage holin family protein [Opitutaceae bacterium]|jgi:uncharacterized membrane protein YqjE|nr:phage holin family protein [Opitutaceae bacterium]